MNLYKIEHVGASHDESFMMISVSNGDGQAVEGLVKKTELKALTQNAWEKHPEQLAGHYFFSTETNSWKAFIQLLEQTPKPFSHQPMVSGLITENEIESLKSLLRFIFDSGQTVTLHLKI